MKVDLIQRSSSWLEWRENKIGSSDAAAIMGLNPWCTPKKLWEKKKGLTIEYRSPEMQRGIDLEEEALNFLNGMKGLKLIPCCFTHDQHPFIASLDGYDEKAGVLCEIKVSNRLYNDGTIPEMYNAQMQHQFMCSGLKKGFYFAYNGFDGMAIEVRRDDAFIEQLITKELEFLEFLNGDAPPPSTEKEYICIPIDCKQKNSVESWMRVSDEIKNLEAEEKRLRKEICDLTDDGNCLLSYNDEPLLKLQRIQREGSVDWVKLCKTKEITQEEVNSFRKQQIGYWKLDRI